MLSRSLIALALALAASIFSSSSAEASQRSLDFSSRSISASIGQRGHRVSRRRRAPRKQWVAGHYVHENRQAWVPGAQRSVYVEPVYRTRYDEHHQPYEVLIAAGHYREVHDAGHYKIRRVRVWKPGFWRVIQHSGY